MDTIGKFLLNVVAMGGVAFIAAMPSSSSYQLNNYGMGSGGVGNASSANYSANAISGEVSNQESGSSNYKIRSGNNNVQQSHVPLAPTLTNPSNYYNKLRMVINNANNASDAKFAVAISKDNFVTTQYVKSDNTVGTTLVAADYQTYAAWGGASGSLILGLKASTTYQVKVKAMQGKFTETEYGPQASAATVAPNLTFDIDVSATDSSTNPPYLVNFGNLNAGSVSDSPVKVWVSFDTNADAGGLVYIASQQGGLRSSSAGYLIPSATADLSATAEGFGAQITSTAQSSGGPFNGTSPYNGSAQNVGVTDVNLRNIFGASSPVASGRGSLLLKAKTQTLTPAARDYTDVVTMIASASF